MDKDKIWQSVLAQVQLTLSRAIFSIWFSKTVVKSIKAEGNKQIVEIGAQNSFIGEKLEKILLKKILIILKENGMVSEGFPARLIKIRV